ncbi:hypothetical protein JEQ12_010589 [Ovis aries]|uniref:Uncharacterized protein n=1 Tax=Ovis aries TaxID=9940 RepID=A0A835ZYR8_SHEEP|nr:hypothetical protein JEQ12_010589 [Ovis aries]
MVLQARNKHREAAPKPPQPHRASQSTACGVPPDVGAGEPGPEPRGPPSPRGKGAACKGSQRPSPPRHPPGAASGGGAWRGLARGLGLRRSGAAEPDPTLR